MTHFPLLSLLLLAPATLLASATAYAVEWLDPGDVQLRSDLATAVDSGRLDLPMLGWPIPKSDVCDGLPAAEAPGTAESPAVAEALDRLRVRCVAGPVGRVYAYAGDPAQLRGFGAEPRSDQVAGAALVAGDDAWSARLEVSAHANPQDDLPVRPDGTYVAVQTGNWAWSAGWLDRWWGPGWDGSLIWSNNARPIPGVALDRVRSRPFESGWLSWIGPWRATFFLGALEHDRVDVDDALFLGIRFAARPLHGLEIALSRTAQFCGDGLPCDLRSFKDLLIGNDNVGLDVTAEREPGNQMAGVDVRWSSPIGDAPYALYGQIIGEDESHYLPEKVLKLYGVDVLVNVRDKPVRAYLEFTDIKCSSLNPNKVFNCAYNQGLFFQEGYRYRGRVIGHALDSDGRMWTAGAVWSGISGWQFDAVARFAEINRGGAPDPRHTISPTPLTRYELAAGARRVFGWGMLELRLAATYDEPDGPAPRDLGASGFVGVSRAVGGGPTGY